MRLFKIGNRVVNKDTRIEFGFYDVLKLAELYGHPDVVKAGLSYHEEYQMVSQEFKLSARLAGRIDIETIAISDTMWRRNFLIGYPKFTSEGQSFEIFYAGEWVGAARKLSGPELNALETKIRLILASVEDFIEKKREQESDEASRVRREQISILHRLISKE